MTGLIRSLIVVKYIDFIIPFFWGSARLNVSTCGKTFFSRKTERTSTAQMQIESPISPAYNERRKRLLVPFPLLYISVFNFRAAVESRPLKLHNLSQFPLFHPL